LGINKTMYNHKKGHSKCRKNSKDQS